MDFFNRVRKIRTNNESVPGDYDTRNLKSMADQNSFITNNAGGKSRKVYKLSKGHNSQYFDSGGGEETHDSGGENDDRYQMTVKQNIVHNNVANFSVKKKIVTPMSSAGDSGLDSSSKRLVTQTDSNTSTGSISKHHAGIKQDLERKLAINIPKPQSAFRNQSVSYEQTLDAEQQSASELEAYNDNQDKLYKKKKKKFITGNQSKDNDTKRYPVLSTSSGTLNHKKICNQPSYSDSDESEEKYTDDIEKITNHIAKVDIADKPTDPSSRHYQHNRKKDSNAYNSGDFADDENDEDAKSSGSSNNGHVQITEPLVELDNKPIVETTAIVSKKPVKIELSNKVSLGGIHHTLDSGHASPLVVTTSNSDKDCSCTTTSSEFQSSHHQCCSSDTSNSIKNIGNNNNNKKIIEASITKKNDDKEHVEKKESLSSVNRNKQYPNNITTVANLNSNSRASITNPNQTKPADYAYASKFATSIAKVPSSHKIQPTSKRVNGVTLRDLYSLRAVLSDSDNGTVFSGRRRIDNAAVAIKRIMKGKVKRWHMIKEKSVPMEIALLRKVNETRHAGVVTLLEWFECSDCFLLVMARPTPVLDLFDYVSEKKRLDESTSKMIFVQVVEAMVHCHLRSVLHRDIKLENILVKTDTLISTIIDFGCGTHLHSNLYKDFAGTPQYYPPEYYICKQYHGLPAAVWSVGVMLYAMLCGRLPFASASEIVHLEPSWHGSFCRKISPAAKDLVENMLKKQPRRRLQMSEILKHRWLKNAKYNPSTGVVTVTDDQNNSTSNGHIFHDTDSKYVTDIETSSDKSKSTAGQC